jgi:hypothetical protein
VPRRRLKAAVPLGVAVLLSALPARAADGDPPAPRVGARAASEPIDAPSAVDTAPPPRNVQLTFRFGARFAQLAPFSHVYSNVLAAYGYGPMTAFLETSADAAYTFVQRVELGAHAGYLFASGGSDGGSGGLLTLHTLELGGTVHVLFFRGQYPWAGGIGFGAEGGVEIPFLLLRGQATTAPVPYGGPSIFARFSDDPAVQPVVHLRYIISNWPDAFANKVGMPLGGLSITLGANLSL